MRLIGILLIIAGLFYAIARPWFGAEDTTTQLAKAVIFDQQKIAGQNRGWQVSNVFLDKVNSPARVRINVLRLPADSYDNRGLKLLVRVAPISQSGEIQAAEVNQPVIIDLENGFDNPAGGNARLHSISTEEFQINRTGQYKIGAVPVSADNVTTSAPALEIDRNIIRIEAVVLSGIEATGSSGLVLGVAMVLFGFILLSIFKRQQKIIGGTQETRRPPEDVADSQADEVVDEVIDEVQSRVENDDTPEREVPPQRQSKTGVGKTIKWGRDAGKKR